MRFKPRFSAVLRNIAKTAKQPYWPQNRKRKPSATFRETTLAFSRQKYLQNRIKPQLEPHKCVSVIRIVEVYFANMFPISHYMAIPVCFEYLQNEYILYKSYILPIPNRLQSIDS